MTDPVEQTEQHDPAEELEQEFSEHEWSVRMSIFGMMSNVIIDRARPSIEHGDLDPDDVADALDDHIDTLDQLPTDHLLSILLVDLPDEYFYEA